ncbi:hypothetical protein [Sediminibacillus massiliensis]|nr:hypothetical protein [Sediminibacillus massiliensis]
MSQTLRNDLMNDLRNLAFLNEEKVNNMTDSEVEYYHWLYLEEESVYNLM